MTVIFKAENSELRCYGCSTKMSDIVIDSVEQGEGELMSSCVVMHMQCPNCGRVWRHTTIVEAVR